MAEYIKREEAMGIFGDAPMWNGYHAPYPFKVHCAIIGIAKLIKEGLSKVPVADVAPVRHGHWDEGHEMMTCTNCCEQFDLYFKNDFNYCPNCGAKMDEVSE